MSKAWSGHPEGWHWRPGKGLVDCIYTAPDGLEFTSETAALQHMASSASGDLDRADNMPEEDKQQLLQLLEQRGANPPAVREKKMPAEHGNESARDDGSAAVGGSASVSADAAAAAPQEELRIGDAVSVSAGDAVHRGRVVQVQTQRNVLRRVKVQFDGAAAEGSAKWIDVKKMPGAVSLTAAGGAPRGAVHPQQTTELPPLQVAAAAAATGDDADFTEGSSDEDGDEFSMWLEDGESGDAVRRLPAARMKRSLTTEKTLPPELLANALHSRADRLVHKQSPPQLDFQAYL